MTDADLPVIEFNTRKKDVVKTEDEPEAEPEDEAVPDDPQEEIVPAPPKPSRKKGGINKKRVLLSIVVVVLIIGGSIGGIIALQNFAPSNVTGLSIEVTKKDQTDQMLIISTVRTTALSRPFSGDVNLKVSDGSNEYRTQLKMDEGSGFHTLDFEDFYYGNGRYTFTISLDSKTASQSVNLLYTAEHIEMTIFPHEQNKELQVSFDLYSSSGGSKLTGKVSGTGTIAVYDGNTSSGPLSYQNDYSITRDRIASTGITAAYEGGYKLTIPYSMLQPTTDRNNYTVVLEFDNSLPLTPVISAEVEGTDEIYVS